MFPPLLSVIIYCTMHVLLAWNCCHLSPNPWINNKIFISQIHESVLLIIIFSESHYSQLGINFNTPKPANQAGSRLVQNEFSAIVIGNSPQHAPYSQHTLAVSHVFFFVVSSFHNHNYHNNIMPSRRKRCFLPSQPFVPTIGAQSFQTSPHYSTPNILTKFILGNGIASPLSNCFRIQMMYCVVSYFFRSHSCLQQAKALCAPIDVLPIHHPPVASKSALCLEAPGLLSQVTVCQENRTEH
jgi:hypothetical protein